MNSARIDPVVRSIDSCEAIICAFLETAGLHEASDDLKKAMSRAWEATTGEDNRPILWPGAMASVEWKPRTG
jgi:hypothetical protein